MGEASTPPRASELHEDQHIKMLSPNSRIPSLGRPGLKHLGQGGMQRILVLAADQLILLQASDVMRTPENLVALGEITNCYEML